MLVRDGVELRADETQITNVHKLKELNENCDKKIV